MALTHYVDSIRNFQSRWIGITAVLCTIVITPELNLDPINWGKFIALITGSAIVLSSLTFRQIFSKNINSILTSMMIFLVVFSLIVSNSPIGQSIWGVQGRATGVLTHIAFLIMLICSIQVTSHHMQIFRYFFTACSFNLAYMVVQYFGLDFADWTVPETFGFLGNINFSSALIGMFVSSLLPIIFGFGHNRIQGRKLIIIIMVIVALFLIASSGSFQGIYMLGMAFSIFICVRASQRFSSLGFLYLGSSFIVIAFLVFLLPLTSRTLFHGALFQETMSFRLDYWKAALQIVQFHPLGIGPDSYGDYYRQFRDLDAITKTGPDRVSNSAHSVLLDLTVSFGVIFAIIFFCFLLITAKRALRIIYLSKSKFWQAIVLAWFAYTPQFFFGISNIGTSIWFWVFSGLILGFTFSSDDNNGSAQLTSPRRVQKSKRREKASTSISESKLPANVFIRCIVLTGVGFIVSIPPLLADASFTRALRVGDLVAMEDAARNEIGSSTFLQERLLNILVSQNRPELAPLALQTAEKNILFNTRSYYSWGVISDLQITPPETRERAIKELARLDPIAQRLKR